MLKQAIINLNLKDLKKIKSKKINTIIALKQDRIAKSIFDWKELMRFLEEKDDYDIEI